MAAVAEKAFKKYTAGAAVERLKIQNSHVPKTPEPALERLESLGKNPSPQNAFL